MKNKRLKLGIMLFSLVLFAFSVNPTYAWFKKVITSNEKNIVAGGIDVKVNGRADNFDVGYSRSRIYPGEYLGSNNKELVYEIRNDGSIPVLFTSGFKFSNENDFLLNGLIVEGVTMELYNRNGQKIRTKKYINNNRVDNEFYFFSYFLDKYRVNGSYGRDGKLSFREFNNPQNWMLNNLKGYTMGMLKPGCKEIWRYKVKMDSSATDSRFRNRSVRFSYKVFVGQRNLEVLRELTKDNVVRVGPEVNSGYFNSITQWRYTLVEYEKFNIQ